MGFKRKTIDPAKAERIAAKRAQLDAGVQRDPDAPTEAEARRYMARVAALGCILCLHLGFGATAAEVHHPRLDVGGGEKCSDFDTIPLCPPHHRHDRYAVHNMGHEEFTAHYGVSERELQQRVKRMLKGRR